jgi:hypothetical protein
VIGTYIRSCPTTLAIEECITGKDREGEKDEGEREAERGGQWGKEAREAREKKKYR